MKKLEISQMENLQGGYSWLYCATHSFDVIIFGLVIHEGHTGGSSWDACRTAKD